LKRYFSIILLISVLLSNLTFKAFAATETVIDTKDTAYYEQVGAWAESTSTSVLGPKGNYSKYGSASDIMAIYDGSHLAAGTYGVYFWVMPVQTVADYMDVVVEISGIGKVYKVNGYDGGKNTSGHYVYLGRHTINSTDTFKVIQKHAEGYSGQLRTGGVKFVLNDTNTSFDYHSTETIITTTSSLYSESGVDGKSHAWDESTGGKRNPLNGLARYTNSKEDYATYSAKNLQSGNYGVYFYVHPQGSATAKLVDIKVSASGTETTIITKGAHGGLNKAGWIYLGNYDFAGNDSSEKITQQINAESSGGFMRAFAVKFIKNDTNSEVPPYSEKDVIISTNASSTFFSKSSGWTQSSVATPIGGTGIVATSSSATATFKANGFNSKRGVYVYMNPQSNETDYADAKITASGTTKTVKLDAKNCFGGAGWVYLGTYTFNGNSNDKVVIAKNASAASGSLNVSAVKFVLDDDSTLRPGNIPVAKKITLQANKPIVLDTNDSGFQKYYSWIDSSVSLTGAPCYYSSAKGRYALWKIDVGAQKGVNVYIPKLSGSTSANEATATDYEVYANGKSTVKTVNYHDEGTGWLNLGTFDFAGGGEEYVKITSKGTGNSRVIAIKLSLEKEEEIKTESILTGNEKLHIFERMGMYLADEITEAYMNKKVTRADMAVMLTRLFGKVDNIYAEISTAPSGTVSHFDDTIGHDYQNTLAWIKIHPEFGIKKQGSNSFSPDSYATRTELIKFILQQLGYYEGIDYSANKVKAYAESLGIKTDVADELTPATMAEVLYSAFEIPVKNDSEYTFFEKLVRENGGIQDDSLLTRTPLSSAMKARRDEAKNKDRNVIYNNDGNDVYKEYPEYPGEYPVTDEDRAAISESNFLKTRTSGIYNSKVNTVYYCTGVVNSYTHISNAISAQKGIDIRKRDWSYLLEEYTGKDTLETMIDYCEKGNIDVFWSMRMNDVHDHAYEVEYLDSWKRANLDKLFAAKEDALFMQYGSRYWSLIDYTYQESRQKMYDILEDTVSRYDVDGIELDFTRWPLYFREVSKGYTAYPENVERMNEFMRMVRALTEKYSMERNKPILISIYVPDSIDFCYDQGLDIRKWLEEDLFDIAVIGCHSGYFQSWEDGIAEYEGKVPVYAALDPLGYVNNGESEEADHAYYVDRHEAYLAYKAGAKGVYTYNYFNISHERFDNMYDINSCGEIDSNYTTERKLYGGIYSVDSKKYVTLSK